MPLEMEAASGAGVRNEMTSDTSAAKRIKLSPSPVTVKEEPDCECADPEFEFAHLLGVPEKIHTIKVEEPDEDIDIKYEPIGIVEEEPMEIEQSLSQHAEPERSNVQTQPFEEVLLPSSHDNGPPSPPNVTSEPIAASVKKFLLLSSHLQNHSTDNDTVPTPNVTSQPSTASVKKVFILSSDHQTDSTDSSPPSPPNVNSISVPITPSLKEVLHLSSNLHVNTVCPIPNVTPITPITSTLFPIVMEESENIQKLKNNLVKFEKDYRNHIIEHTIECRTQLKTYNNCYFCPFCFYIFPCNSSSFLLHMGFELGIKVSSRLLDIHKITIHCDCVPCIFCSTIYDSIQSYQKHIDDVKHDFGQHLCLFCDLMFISLCALNRHRIEMHEPKYEHHCSLCNMHFPNNTTFEMHKSLCRRDMYYCVTCDHYYMTPMESDDHSYENKSHTVIKVDPAGIIQSLPISVKMKPCDSESSTNVQETNCHTTTPLSITETTISDSNTSEIANIENTTNQNISVPKNSSELISRFSGDLFSKFESLNRVKNELMIISLYVCPYCCMIFTTKLGFLFHVGVVIGNTNSETYTKAHLLPLKTSRLKCVHCEVIVSPCNLNTYHAHLRTKHLQPPKYQCGKDCKARFAYVCELNKHKMSCVKFGLFMSCNNCKATFQNILGFWSHERICKKFNTFCIVCKQPFQTRFRYENHQCNKQRNNPTCVLVPILPQDDELSIYDFLKCTKCESASVCPELKILNSKFVARN